MKCLVRKTSLQRISGRKIIDYLDDLFNFCEAKITDINFIKVVEADFERTDQKLITRYASAVQIPGKRNIYRFLPLTCEKNKNETSIRI